MEVNGTEARAEEAAVTLALSVAVTVISAIGLLLNAYILFIIVITKQVIILRTLNNQLYSISLKTNLVIQLRESSIRQRRRKINSMTMV